MAVNEYYTADVQGPFEEFELGAFPLSTGFTLPEARLAYKTHGTLNEARDNAILLPHMYTGTLAFMDAYVGEGRPLDPTTYFIIQPSQLGSGMGSSPSNTPPPFNGAAFPPVAIVDDVHAQHRLITEHFGIETLQLVSGWSMGGQQTYGWAVQYPDMVKRAMPIAATAVTPEHNRMFIDLHTQLLTDDPAWEGGFYTDSHAVHRGLRRHAEALALMGITAEALRVQAYRELGFQTRDDWQRGFVEAYFLPMDPNNLLCTARKWRAGEIGAQDADAALGRITARTRAVAFNGDLFFPPEVIEEDAARIAAGEFRSIGSVWGHFTMFGLREGDVAEIDAMYAEILAS
ncbi:MAG: alpha/beta fold hydrolase [Solirubrobacterales bacterium]|nr:alpha/beta fold hydrolase [Solirubrobacterales bacterium]